jgi:hypothetical protein
MRAHTPPAGYSTRACRSHTHKGYARQVEARARGARQLARVPLRVRSTRALVEYPAGVYPLGHPAPAGCPLAGTPAQTDLSVAAARPAKKDLSVHGGATLREQRDGRGIEQSLASERRGRGRVYGG